MELHYNVHYKGYVEKLNNELMSLKSHPNSIEKIVRGVSKYNQNIKNNVGGRIITKFFGI